MKQEIDKQKTHTQSTHTQSVLGREIVLTIWRTNLTVCYEGLGLTAQASKLPVMSVTCVCVCGGGGGGGGRLVTSIRKLKEDHHCYIHCYILWL